MNLRIKKIGFGIFLSFFISCLSFLHSKDDAVTYAFSGGRFGDSLLCYLHAKWISYQNEIPLLYKPFNYSSYLVLDEKEELYEDMKHLFRRTIEYSPVVSIEPKRRRRNINILYLVPYFPEDKEERAQYSYFDIDWKNNQFRSIIYELLAPKSPLKKVDLPQDSINIAIHVREGGGYDTDHTRYYAPKKLPPMHFYIDALLNVLSFFEGKRLYCYVFTDALDPNRIVETIKSGINIDYPIVFEYRKENNRPDINVLEDFFSLFNFDVLIRPESNFSIIPSLLKDYAILIYPKKSIIRDGSPYIDQVEIVVNEELYQNFMNDNENNL